MIIKNAKALLFLGLLPFSALVQASPVATYKMVAPHCLIQSLSTPYKTLSSTSSFRLIETNEKGLENLISAKNQLREAACGGFIDVTEAVEARFSQQTLTASQAKTFLETFEQSAHPTMGKLTAEYRIQYPEQVQQLLSTVNPQEIWSNLSYFSNTEKSKFPDRYAGSETGVKAAHWLKTQIEHMAQENGRTDITVYLVATGKRYQQPSVVVKMGHSKEPGIVIGAHMDTLSSKTGGVKPGADDDGSGSMSTMEVARTLITSGMQFKKPLYFIWYSAEEMGLVGSSYVVKDFQAKKIPVEAVLQLDMTGYSPTNDPTIWLVTDYVDKGLTNYLSTLIQTYLKTPVGQTKCGYACSDHASWQKAGVSAAFPFETDFSKTNPYIHSSQDTISTVSVNHMTQFAKLGVAFAVELAQPITVE